MKDRRFRLTHSALGIVLRNGKEVPITIREGTIIELIGGPFEGTRLMDVRCDDEMLLMFTTDLEGTDQIRRRRGGPNSPVLQFPAARTKSDTKSVILDLHPNADRQALSTENRHRRHRKSR
jgi:hypothetical protein